MALPLMASSLAALPQMAMTPAALPRTTLSLAALPLPTLRPTMTRTAATQPNDMMALPLTAWPLPASGRNRRCRPLHINISNSPFHVAASEALSSGTHGTLSQGLLSGTLSSDTPDTPDPTNL